MSKWKPFDIPSMTDEETEIAKRLAVHDEWEWLRSLRVVTDCRGHSALRLISEETRRCWCTFGDDGGHQYRGWITPWQLRKWRYIPDLADEATQGVMLAAIRKEWPLLSISRFDENNRISYYIESNQIPHFTGCSWPTYGLCLGHAWLLSRVAEKMDLSTKLENDNE